MKRIGRRVVLGLGLFLLTGSAFSGDIQRQLFTITFPQGAEAVGVPVRLTHRLAARSGTLTEVDASGTALQAVPAAFSAVGEMTAQVGAQPAGRRRIFWLGAGALPLSEPQVRLQPAKDAGAPLRIVARTYEAEVDPKRGGVLASLVWLAPGGRRLETLGPGGMNWTWTGSPGRADQNGQGATSIEVIENGPGRVVLSATAGHVLGPGNTFTVTSCFYPECIDQHYEFRRKTACQTSALKLWCFLSPKGNRTGLKSAYGSSAAALLRSGRAVWTPDPVFVDMTFDDPGGFGLGFIGVKGCRRLYMEDPAGNGDPYNLFVDATGYNGKMQEVTSDVDEWVRLVSHGPGPTAARTTRTFALPPTVRALGVQLPGGALPDSDHDGLDDLAELRAGTNPLAADTDGDGLVDGLDPQPLQHAHPETAVAPEPAEPLAPPVATDRPQSVAQIREINGAPTIVVNGRPFGPMTFTIADDYSVDYLKPFVAADLRIFSIYTDGGFSRPGDEGLKHLDRKMQVVLKANPNAFVLVRPMYIETPETWAKQHPGELFTLFDGTTRLKDETAPKEGKPHYTFASEVWKADVGRALRRLIDHVRRSAYSDRVIGYFIGAGYPTEEWIWAPGTTIPKSTA
ncbi:MAG: thrombospondin type 3 repeat-containing protein [Thermoguttaceae bacterium]